MTDALAELQERFPVRGEQPPLTGFALDPATMLYVLDYIEKNRIFHVVECGSGSSTIYIAEFFHRQGRGQIVSLEHDERFYERTRQELVSRGLCAHVDVRLASLKETVIHRRWRRWYDPEALIGLVGVSLLLIDGPPGDTDELARLPAVPLFNHRMARRGVIILDDADRPDEQEAIRQWGKFGWRVIDTPPGRFAALKHWTPHPEDGTISA